MTRIVINTCYGGFSLSPEAELRLYELGCPTLTATPVEFYFPLAKRGKEPPESLFNYEHAIGTWRAYRNGPPGKQTSAFMHTFTPDEQFILSCHDLQRDDPFLLQVLLEMGDKAFGSFADLLIVEIPDDVEWQIEEYDGREWIAEKHRVWP